MRLTEEISGDATEGTSLRNRAIPISEQGKRKPVQFYANFIVLQFFHENSASGAPGVVVLCWQVVQSVALIC